MNTMEGPGTLGQALRAWRQRLDPDAIGLQTYGERRRVRGLRREELAMLAGVSSSYYTRLEQGQSRNASDNVLEALASALQLSSAERAHLHDLADAGSQRRIAPKRPPIEHIDSALSQLLTALGTTPALVLGRRGDVLAWNSAGHALLGEAQARGSVADPRLRPNMTELIFLDAHQRELYCDWPSKARAVVGNLRHVVGRHPDDPLLTAMVGRLCVASHEFSRLWADHRVNPCATAVYMLRHPLLGALSVTQQSLRCLQSPDQVLVTCTPADEPSAQALSLLSHIVTSGSAGVDSPVLSF